jgi:tetratricopeptide (TPR) repeat protein
MGCVIGGVVLGVTILMAMASGKEAPSARPGPPPPHVPTVEELIGRIDECIEAEDYRTANRICNRLIDSDAEATLPSVRYRQALAREGLGQNEEAIQQFAELSKSEKSLGMALAANFGEARCLVMAGRWNEAMTILARLDLIRDHPAWGDKPVGAEIEFWRAAIYISQLQAARPATSLTTKSVLSLGLHSPAGRYLTWGMKPEESEAAKPNIKPLAIETRLIDGFVPRFTWRCSTGSMAERLQELAARLKLRLNLTPEAKKRIENQEAEFAIDSIRLPNMLADLLEVRGLVWTLTGNELAIRERGDRESVDSERGRRIRATLRAAASAEIDHPFREAANLELANFSAYGGRLADAARQYEQIVSEFPSSAAARLAQFNQGLVRMRGDDPDSARELFLDVIDRSPKDELAGRAWWFIARTYLDAGDTEGAAHPLKMAAANSSLEVRAAAAVGLSAARLFTGADAEGHAALGRGPLGLLRKEPFRHEMIFLDAYSRFRLARHAYPHPLIETEDLLNALSSLAREPILGPIGTLLHGRALHDLAMDDRMADYFERVLPELTSPLVGQMAETLAEHYLKIGKVAEAGRALLAFGRPERFDSQIQLLFAEVAQRQSRPQECLAICRGCLADPKANRTSILKLMGRAFESLGDSRKAAECYAGRVPEN